LQACNFLTLALFGGTPYSVDQAGVVKCVVKVGCVIGADMQIADKMSMDLSYVDGRAHEATEDRGLVGSREWDVRRQLEITRLEAIGVITGEAEPCLRSSDFKAGASILRRYTTVNVGRECGTRLKHLMPRAYDEG
jgi:hypothetical protein